MASLFTNGVFQGPPLGTLETYAAGTLTPQATYTDRDQGTTNPTTIDLDANGYADVWLGAGLFYRFRCFDADGNLFWDTDNHGYEGGIAIPADNDATGVLLYASNSTGSSDGKLVAIKGGNVTGSGSGGWVSLTGGGSSTGDSGRATINGGWGFNGGDVYINGGVGTSSSGNVLLQTFAGATEAGDIRLAPGSHDGPGNKAGDLYLDLGQGLSGATDGKLIVKRGSGGSQALVSNNAQNVTVGNVGPGSAAVSIKGWLPISVDSGNYWIPLFGV